MAWSEVVWEALTRDRLPPVSIELPFGRETEVAAGTHVRPRGDVAFIRHREGYSRILGREGLEAPADGYLPISRRGWLQTAVDCRLFAVEPHEPDAPTVWAGLGHLLDVLLRSIELNEAAREQAALERLQQKTLARETTLRDACERLAASMNPGRGPAGGAEVADSDDALVAACALVGRAAGLRIRAYPRTQGAPEPRDPLAAVLRASRVRGRKVALAGTWWRDDNGPLLGRLAESKRPVALLPVGAGGRGYLLRDPVERSERPVDERVAETLEPFAHSFYRPFPETRLGVRDVLRFALQGCAADAGVMAAMALCATVLGMVPAMATGMLFNTVIPGAQRSQLLQLTWVLLACALATALFTLVQNIAFLRIEGRAGSALQAAVWDRLLTLPLSFFRPYTAGDLAVRAMSIDSIRQVISGATVSALLGSVMALGNVTLMFWYSWRMALWATLLIAVALAVSIFGSYRQLRPQREVMKLASKTSGLVLQLLGSVSKLRVAGVEVPAFALWVQRFSEQRRLQYQARAGATWVSAFSSAVPLLSNLVIFWIALPLIAEERLLGTGDFLAFLSAYSSSSGALLSASLALLATLNTLPMYEQSKPILEALPEVDEAKSDPGALSGDIEVQHAQFRYQQDGPLVLRDVSFRIKAGEFVAFVGPSGSGKSTLMRLLLGFERLEAGAIYFDGQEIGGLDVQALRRQMGVVLQSGRMMSGDIFTNIAGSGAATIDEAWEAARMAGFAEDIESMPMGMHTVISEGGGTLSGGQRQRLLIARAIVNRPRILLFDEATSALDNRTQAIVSASLERLQATRIVVAHRLSTILNADRIFVLERGRLVQSGTYAELMGQPGPFAELASRQIA
jgi:ATP-binding cassette subfamily C protein